MDRDTQSRPAQETGERVRPIARDAHAFESPEEPIVPVCHGDGVGQSVVPAAQRVLETAAALVDRRVKWLPVAMGEDGRDRDGHPLPARSLEVLREFSVGLIGPTDSQTEALTRPLESWLRHELGCQTTVVSSPTAVRGLRPSSNTTVDEITVVYDTADGLSSSLECPPESGPSERAREFAADGLSEGVSLHDGPLSVGLRPISKQTTERTLNRAIHETRQGAGRQLTFVHQGERLPQTDGSLRTWVREIARDREDVITDKRGQDDVESNGVAILDQQPLESVIDQLHVDPGRFDVLFAPPTAGRVLARSAIGIGGGPGLASICYTGNGRLLVTPAHGPRTDSDPQDANPVGTIMAGRELFRALGWSDAATLVADAVELTVADGGAPRPIASRLDDRTGVSPETFADRVVTTLEELAT
jgi:isocitrate dehydrogenase